MTKQSPGIGYSTSSDNGHASEQASAADGLASPDTLYTPFPLTDLQQAYWIGQTDLMELGNVSARIYTEIEFSNLDLVRLSLVIQRLVERHATLRTVILPDGSQQVLPPPSPYQVAVTDLRGQTPEAVAEHLIAQRHMLRQQSIRTDTWPLWDIRASILNNTRTRLHITISLLLVDGRSMAILSAEALHLYQNLDASLPAQEMTFSDCMAALSAIEHSPLYQKSVDYWQRRLDTLPDGPKLPLVKQPAELQTVRFVSHSATLDGQLWQRLKEQALRHGLRSPVAAIYSAYAEVLACWSHTAHFCFTLLFAHRLSQQSRAKGVVGNLSTTILVEVDHRTSDSFIGRAKRLERQLWQDMAHSDVCGVQIIREMGRRQGWSTRAVVPVAFVSTVGLSNQQDKGMFMGTEEQGKVVYYCVQTPQVYLDHQIYETTDGLRLEWDMVDELFPAGLPDTMLTAYYDLLCALAESEDRWQALDVALVPAEQVTCYQAINATTAPLPTDLLHTGFMQQARQYPDRIGVISRRRSLTYAEIDRGSRALGGRLRHLDVYPNSLVAVVMEKGWEQVVATLGILYAGAAYLPIDPSLPQERLWYLLEYSQVQHVLTQPWIDERLAWPPMVQRHHVDESCLYEQADHMLVATQSQDDLAYVIYTSGSTGRPKGVMISHRGAINTLADLNQRFEVTFIDRILALSSLSFDLSVYDIFGILAVGGAVVLPDSTETLNPAHWLELITEHQVTIWNSVPALMEILVEYIGDQRESCLSTLRLAMLSGDWIPLKLPDRLRALHDDLHVVSLGGATEASIWSIFHPIDVVEPNWKSIPYGRPLVNQQIFVLDANLNPRPYWVPGQLYIGGVGLANGYWNDAAKTAASFITHPRTGERLYRTGDMGRYWPDGTIEFLGREDFQVKVQGHRIELGEIEAVLAQHPAIREAIVTVETNARGEKRLMAYVVPQPGPQPSSGELLAHARAKLPSYMMPAALHFLDALPLSSNGKVDRKALPMLGVAEPSTPMTASAPRNQIEQELVELWETVLDRHPIGINDDFFELGGNSLAALRLMIRIRQRFSQDLPFSMLFEGTTVARMCGILQHTSARAVDRRSPLITIRASGSKPAFFCFHPVGGTVFCYADLARQMPDHPFYALEALEFGEALPHQNIVTIAAAYKATIEAIQPHGPYMLGGWSMGGLIAYETARQLCDLGQQVGLVALIDSAILTPAEREEPPDDTDLLAWFAKDLWSSVGKHAGPSAAELRTLEPEGQIVCILEEAKRAGVLTPEVNRAQLLRLIEVFKAHTRALYSYQPQTSCSPVALFAAKETLDTYGGDGTLGWDMYTGPSLTVYPLAGDHYSLILPPTVVQLAELLSNAIVAHAGRS